MNILVIIYCLLIDCGMVVSYLSGWTLISLFLFF